MKSLKKSISVVLSLIIVFSCCGALLAQAADDYDHLPQVYVSGIGSRKVYFKDDPNKTSLFYPIDQDRFLGNLNNFGEYAKESIAKGDPNILYNCVYSWLWDTFGATALEGDGFTMNEAVTVDPCPLDYDGNGRYIFNYDSRLDPVDLAAQLHEYIGWVQEDSGSQRVELVGSSFGTSIVAAYLNEYKEYSENIDSVVLCVPSLGGVQLVGELFSGSFNLDPDNIEDYVEIALGNEDLDLILGILNKSGALDVILDAFLEPTLRVALLKAVTDIVHDVIGTYPSMWAFVQDEHFYEAVEFQYGENYNDPNHEYAGLIEKITYYHDNIMVRATDIFKEATDSGIKMNIIAKYDRPPVPLSEYGNFMSDGVMGLSVASFGATCSMLRETLPEDYEQALYPEYNFLSADGCIDASTGALPFNTWYIRGLEHSEKPAAYYALIEAIAYNNIDIHSDPQYPQFLQYKNGELVPLEKVEPDKEGTLVQDFIRLLTRLIQMITQKILEFTSK